MSNDRHSSSPVSRGAADASPVPIDDDPVFRLARFEQTPNGLAVRWQLKRNCSLTPKQLMACVAVMLLVSACAALMFWGLGYALVSLFVLVQMGATVVAAWSYARHACDHDTVVLQNGRLAVEQCCGSRTDRTEFYAPFVRIEAGTENDSLVSLSERGRKVEVGRHVQPATRRRMAMELHRALLVS
jgi:uncharacterized membrane protein